MHRPLMKPASEPQRRRVFVYLVGRRRWFYGPLSLSRRFQERKHLPQLVPETRWHMIQSFREKAERAERLARSFNDQRTCDALLNYARECRGKLESQFDNVPPREPEPSRRPGPARPTDASGAECPSVLVLRALCPVRISVSSSLLAAPMNQKSSLREVPQFVSGVLTGNNLQ